MLHVYRNLEVGRERSYNRARLSLRHGSRIRLAGLARPPAAIDPKRSFPLVVKSRPFVRALVGEPSRYESRRAQALFSVHKETRYSLSLLSSLGRPDGVAL